jgi:hypothetical protein
MNSDKENAIKVSLMTEGAFNSPAFWSGQRNGIVPGRLGNRHNENIQPSALSRS